MACTEEDFEAALQGALMYPDEEGLKGALEALGHDDAPGVARVSTFAEKGVLTRNKGLVIRLADGSEFQLTIVRSK